MMARKQMMFVEQDLRNRCDRRSDEIGPPLGWRERRRNVERRMPTVKEDEISQQEWFRRMATFMAHRRAEKAAIRKAFESLESASQIPLVTWRRGEGQT